MNLITDRTEADVILGTAKGLYQAQDLNRVENAVKTITADFPRLGFHLPLVVKTDWKPPEDFSQAEWVTESQMIRYLDNIKKIRDLFPMNVPLPDSMSNLSWHGANNIEKVLQIAAERISAIKNNYRYSGEVYAGEELI